jgi:hypothetical protein
MRRNTVEEIARTIGVSPKLYIDIWRLPNALKLLKVAVAPSLVDRASVRSIAVIVGPSG